MIIHFEAEDLLRAARSIMEGPDFWQADHFLQMPQLWWQQFAKLWTAVLSTSVVPQAWRKSWVLLLDKKINETRPISISSVAWRIGAKALNRKLLPWLNSFLDHRALGSAPARSASDVHARLFLAMRQNCNTFVQQDLSSFFDSLDHGAMERALTRLGAPSCFVNLFRAFYADSRRLFRVASCFTPDWQVATQGCLQGCPLSPTVALCYGYILWSHYCSTRAVECAIYVDDRILWPNRPGDASAGRALAEALNKSDLVDKAFGLNCRPEKCALLAPEGDQTLRELWHRKYPKQQVLHTLGVVIDVCTWESTLLKLSLRMALLRLRYLRTLNPPLDIKRRLIRSLIMPTFTWAAGALVRGNCPRTETGVRASQFQTRCARLGARSPHTQICCLEKPLIRLATCQVELPDATAALCTSRGPLLPKARWPARACRVPGGGAGRLRPRASEGSLRW